MNGTIMIVTVLLFATFPFISQCANILILHPIYCGSHELVLRSLGDLLVNRGHQVTQVRYKHTNAHEKPNTNVSVVTLDIVDHLGNCDRYIEPDGALNIKKAGAKILWDEGHSVLGLPTDIFCLTDAHCHTLYNSQTVARILNETQFDLVIVDFIANECSLALAASLDVPMVGFWGFSFHGGEVAFTSAFNPPSVHPQFFSGLNRKMNFLSRVCNVMLHMFHRLYLAYQVHYANHYVKAKFPQIPETHKLVHDLDLILVNTNNYIDYAKLLPPNVIPIGGFHLPDKPDPLPKDYEAFVSGADKGVVLFSLGYTGFSAKDIPQKVVYSLMQVFASLEERVIMRFDADVLPFIPENVLVSDWVPQMSILGHPKTKAFFTHCGISSVTESVYFGVPMIAVGIFADQVDNAAIVEDLGVAYRLTKEDLANSELVSEAVNRVLYESAYREKAKQLSDMWHDERTKEDGIHQLEMLIKYGHLRHLRIEDHDLTLLEYFSLDVVLLLILVLAAIVGLVRRSCQFVTWKKMSEVREKTE